MIEPDVGGGFGVRGEFYPGGLSDPVRGSPSRPSGQVDRGSARAPDGDQSLARGRLRPRDRLHARRHDPRPARPRLRRHGRLYPHQRRRGAGEGGAIPARPLPHPRRRHHCRSADDQQDAGRHHACARPVRGEFLSRAAARHRRARPRARSDGLPPQEPDRRGRAALRHRQARALRGRDRFRHRRLSRHFRTRARRDRLGREEGAAGQARRRALARACRHAVRGERRLRQGERAGRDRAGRLRHRLCRLLRARAGARDHAGAGRRRYAQASVRARAHPAWLDHLSARGLRHLCVALHGGGRLGGHGRLQQSARSDSRCWRRNVSACPTRRS